MSPQCARVMIRRITTGSAALGKDAEQLDILLQSANSVTTLLGARSPWSATLLDVHANGGQRHYMHAGSLVALIVILLLLMAGVPKSSIVLEKKGLRSGNRTRPMVLGAGDIVVLD